MILKEKTKEVLGINVDVLKCASTEKILVRCDNCLKEREVIFRSYNTNCRKNIGDFCRACSRERATEKREATNMERYGFKHPSQSLEVRERLEKTNLSRYGSKNAMQNPEVRDRAKKTSLERYGVEYPSKLEEVKERVRQTCLDKYGVKHYFQSQDAKQKTKITSLEKYGTEYPCQNLEVQKKQKNTCIERYGVENVFQNEDIKEKIKQTNLEKYGVENPFSSIEIQNKIHTTNLEKYGTKRLCQSDVVKERTKNTIIERYGVEYPMQSELIRDKTKNNNLEKYGIEFTAQAPSVKDKIKNTRIKDGLTRCVDGKLLKEWAQEKGCSYSWISVLYNLYGGEFIKSYEKYYTDIENIIKNILNKNSINYEFNRPLSHNSYRYDFLIDKKFIIEANGTFYHSEKFLPNKNHHKEKIEFYKKQGYDCLFFDSDEIQKQTKIIESLILKKLKYVPEVDIENIQIVEISDTDSRKWFTENDLKGYAAGKTYAVIRNNEVLSAIQFETRGKDLKINRLTDSLFLESKDNRIKLINFVMRKYKSKTVSISINNKYENSEFLRELNFEKIKDFIDFKWTNGKLTFPPKKYSEEEGYQKNFLKIWDCGHEIWELKIGGTTNGV